jgi:hypothetical protein
MNLSTARPQNRHLHPYKSTMQPRPQRRLLLDAARPNSGQASASPPCARQVCINSCAPAIAGPHILGASSLCRIATPTRLRSASWRSRAFCAGTSCSTVSSSGSWQRLSSLRATPESNSRTEPLHAIPLGALSIQAAIARVSLLSQVCDRQLTRSISNS